MTPFRARFLPQVFAAIFTATFIAVQNIKNTIDFRFIQQHQQCLHTIYRKGLNTLHQQCFQYIRARIQGHFTLRTRAAH